MCRELDEFLVAESTDEVLWIRSVGGVPIGDTPWLTLMGSHYPSYDAAIEAGERWRARLERAFASLNIAADFGDRNFNSHLGDVARTSASQILGGIVLSEVHGLMAFPAGQQVHLMGGSASGYAPKEVEALRHAVRSSHNRATYTTQRLAYDLYSQGILASSPDAKFILMMMAVEALMIPFERSPEVQRVVKELLAVVRGSDLSDKDKQVLLSQVGALKRASFRQQGERLAQAVGGRRYGSMSAEEVFVRAYTLRGKLVHGDADRPSQGEVTQMAGRVARFVADLIAGPDLVTDIQASRGLSGSGKEPQ
jgi:hypothetical protein